MNIEERLKKLEIEVFNNTQRRQLDAHYTGQVFNYLVQAGFVDGKCLKDAINKIGENIKQSAGQQLDVVETVNECTAKWLGHIAEPKQFISMTDSKAS